VGGLLAVDIGGQLYFPCYDNNGNVTEYVDASGAVRARYEYSPFGKITAQSGDLADMFRFRFSTKYYDIETGLYYYGYRYYSPELGRFLIPDPIEEDGGLNLYAFVANGPVNKTDYLGMWFATDKSRGQDRRVYKRESGDTLQSLADEVQLEYGEINNWMKAASSNKSGSDIPCEVSVPNVWVSSDLLQGGGVYDRVVNLGGTVGQFIGTDMFTYGYKIVTANNVAGLHSSLSGNAKNIWGMVVFAHGSKSGLIAQSNASREERQFLNERYTKWTTQRQLMALVDLNGYKLSEIYMMQCYSASGKWKQLWQSRTKKFHGYDRLNVLGFDTGWLDPSDWF
jgi:RHS repeat-associated protein